MQAMLILISSWCGKPFNKTCVDKGHQEDCPTHPGNFHTPRDPCVKCEAAEIRKIRQQSKEAKEAREKAAESQKGNNKGKKYNKK